MALRSKRVSVTPDLPGEGTPTEEEVVIQLSDDDIVGLETPEPPAPAEPEVPEPEDDPSPDDVVRRAVEAQQRAEEIARNVTRERDDALRRERERQEELNRERDGRADAEYNGILTSIAAEEATLERAVAEYAAHMQSGEYTEAAKTQSVIARANARLDRLEENKTTFDQKRSAQKTEEPTRPAPAAATTTEQQIDAMQLPDSAKTWLRSHPEMISDPAKNRQITAAHQYLTEIKGLSAFSQPYFDALDLELGFKKPRPAPPAPVHVDPDPVQPQRRSMPVTAPVSRDVPTTSGQRQTASSVTLTPEEVRIAHNSFTDPTGKMTNADKERSYALNKLKLQRMRANGEYPSRERA